MQFLKPLSQNLTVLDQVPAFVPGVMHGTPVDLAWKELMHNMDRGSKMLTSLVLVTPISEGVLYEAVDRETVRVTVDECDVDQADDGAVEPGVRNQRKGTP